VGWGLKKGGEALLVRDAKLVPEKLGNVSVNAYPESKRKKKGGFETSLRKRFLLPKGGLRLGGDVIKVPSFYPVCQGCMSHSQEASHNSVSVPCLLGQKLGGKINPRCLGRVPGPCVTCT